MIGFDFETCLIQPGLLAPPPVCLTTYDGDTNDLIPSNNGWHYMRDAIDQMLSAHDCLIGFNLAFDVGVILQWFPEFIDHVFAKYEQGHFVDVAVLERLGEIATDRPASYAGLQDLASRYKVAELNKAESPRQDYARLLGKEVSHYPKEHIEYAKLDALVTYQLWIRCLGRYRDCVTRAAVNSETRHALWLHLCAAWGFRVDPTNLEALRRAAHENVDRLRGEAERNGFIRTEGPPGKVAREDGTYFERTKGKIGSKDQAVLKRAVAEAYGEKMAWPLADKGKQLLKTHGLDAVEEKHISINKVALSDSGDPLLESFADYGEWAAVVNKDLDMLSFGLDYPIHTKYRMAATTRTTSSAPNVQNFRRLEGVRECVVPRPGKCFGFIDVGGLELGTLAQVIAWKLKTNNMANLINGGPGSPIPGTPTDLHLLAACRLKSWDYATAKIALQNGDKKIKEWRQFCKIANFGYPGFMGAATLVPYARQQGVRITLDQAKDLKQNWQATLPEAARYLSWVKTNKNPQSGRYDFVIPGSPQIVRAGATIASCANGHFQGLGAQTMKECGWRITKESWTNPDSPIYGIPMWIFVHDEFGFEIPIGDQHHVLKRVREIMAQTLHEKLPAVKLDAEPVAMMQWAKNAQPVYGKNGKLLIWEG